MGQGDHSDPYRRSFEAILDGAVLLDSSTGHILLANKAAAAVFNFASPEQMAGLNPLDYVAEEDRQPVAHLLAQGLQVDRPTPAEIRMRTTDGRTIWVSVTTAITEHEGKKATLATLREITSEKAKDAALRQAKYLYQRLFETMLDAAVVLDTATTRVLLANQAAARMFGFASPEQTVGESPLDYIPKEDQERVVRLIADSIERGHLPPTGIRMRTKDGRLLWVSVSVSLIEYEGKKASLATIRDITPEKAKDAALKEAERQYEHLFDGMIDGAVVLDVSSFQIVLANKAAAEMFGFASPRQVIGENPLSYIPEEDRDGVARLIALNLEGKATNPAELRILTRDKRERWVSATATRVDYEGRTAILSTLRDITAYKLKDDALKAAEEGNLRLMDAASEAITIVQDGKLVYVNSAMAQGAGIPREQLIGLAFLDLIHPDERQAVWQRYERLLAGKWPSEVATMRGLNAKGETLWAEIREIPFTWQEKPAVMSLIHDITDKMRLEEERKEREERLRAIIENAWDGITILDENYNVTFESPSLAKIAGYTPEEWMGRPVGQMNIHQDDLGPLLAKIETLKSQPGSVITDVTVRYQHKDGSWRWIEATGHNLLHDPKVKGLVVNYRDITDRVKAEEEVKASEERFRTLIEKATDVVIVLDATGKITYQSPSLERVTGFGHDEWVEKSLGELLIHPDDLPALASLLEQILTEPGAVVEGVTARYQHKDGSWHTLEATVTNMLHDPKVNGLVANFRDITDRKQAAEALEKSEGLLKATETLTDAGGWEYDVETGSMTWTDETYHIHEIPSVPTIDHIGESLKCYPPPARQVIEEAFQKCVAEGTPYDLELPFVTFGGNQRWVRTTARAIREDNRIVRIFGNIADITERKRVEEALRESEAKYKRLFESTQTAMEVINMETGLVALANEATARMFGFASPEELVGEDSTKYLRPEDVGWVAEKMAQAVTDSSWREIAELQVRTKDGRWLWISGTVLQSEYQGKPALLISLLDITSRKRAEETLRESEEKYRLLTEKTNDIIYTTDLDFNDTYVSPSVEKILGFTPREYLGLSPDQRMTLESLAHAQEALLEHLSLEKDPTADPNRTVRIELEFYRKDGSTVWLEHQVSALRDADGNAIGLHGVSRDVTERRKAEQALKESEGKYRLLAEKTNDIIWTTDLSLHTTYTSPSVERILGFTPEERLKQDVTAQMTPESLARAADALKHNLSLEQDPKADPNRLLRIEIEYYRKDGSTVWLENQVSGIRDSNGTLVGLHGVARDVSERRKAEQALKESEAKYRLVAESTNDEIWTSDLNLNTTYVSPSVERILGFTVEERMKQDVMEQMTPESFARAAEALKHHLALEHDPKANPNRVLRIELEYYRKDGSTVWLENQVSGIRDASGKLIGFHGVARDVTERKKSEQALQASEEKYRLLTEKISDLVYTTDLNFRNTYVSPSVERILGFTPEEHMERDAAQQMTPESLARAGEALREQLALEQDPKADPNRTVRIELECYRKDGSTVWLEQHVSFIRDDSGTVVGLHGGARDITESRRAREALRESEERYRLLINNAAEAIAVIQDGLVKFINPRGAELVGRAGEEMMPTPFLDYVHPDDRQMMIENHAKRLAGQEVPNNYTFRILDKEGDTRHIQINAVMFDWEGKPAVLAMLNDITDRVKIQEALATSEVKYRDLFEHTLLGMEVVDAETGKVVLANRSIATMFGFRSPQDMVGTRPIDYVLPEDVEWVAQQMAQVFADPEKRDVVNIRARTEDGRGIWVTGSGTLFSHEGKPSMLLSLVDITATKEAEDRLRGSEEQKRVLIDNAAEAIAVIQDGIAKFFNRRLVEITGWTAEELLTRSFLDLVHPDEREMIALNYMKRIAGEEVPNNYQFRIVDKDGNTRWLQINAVRFDWEGKPATLDMFSDVTERVKAELALKESEERFRALVEKATDAVAVLDAAGNVLYYTPSMLRVTGYKPGEWVDKSLADLLLHPDDLPKLVSVLEEVLREPGGSVENFTTRYQHQDGTWHVLEATARNMLHDPKIGGIVANFRDITERVMAGQALKESEERYRLLAENATDIIWVVDVNLRVTYASPSVTRLLGYTIKEVTAPSFLDKFLAPDSLAHMAQAFTDDLAGEESSPGSWRERVVEIEVLSKKGSKFWLEAAISGIRDSAGRLVGFQGACRDITDRKEAAESLRRSEERFRGLVETTSDWVWEMDRNSRYTYVSPKVRDVLGYEPEELLGHTPFQFMHQREGRRVSKIVRRFSADYLPFSLLENTCTHKDGHSVVLETSAVPIIDSNGTFCGYRGIDRDITERKKVEQELQRSLKRLEKTMESTIEAITTTIETRDPYTTGHQMRVTDLACAIAKVMEVPPTQIEGIRVAGLLHDIGKIAIPTEILSKPGKLNEVEYEMIKTHSKVGYNILKKIEFPWPVARAVLQHHERWNGTGYPHGIRGEDILLEARILAVADVMEAMSSHRPYRPTIGIDKALDEITNNRGILYDPAVADACITVFTQTDFKFAPSLPGGLVEPEITLTSHPVDYLEDH